MSWRWVPPSALSGFVVLLIALFGVSYGVGSAVGPVAPNMRSVTGTGGGTGNGTGTSTGTGTGTGTGQEERGGMDDMHSGGGR
ncbi:hypothetical protein [Streptomyces corynorhini]|uniref:hypothetical protein n=1 Tax=Streptomyces corynorhini TaxID=2282652 RepID=UPI001314A3F2|nr:hypothetical protein [Streptomyces corynorhini]